MIDFLKSLQHILRKLIRRPLFTLVIVASLGLGIGANTTVFTLIKEVFLSSLPVEEVDRLVAIYGNRRDESGRDGVFNGFIPISYPNFLDIRDQNDVFSGVTVWHGIYLGLSGGGKPEQILGEFVSGNYFDLLGLEPARGRFFLPEEDSTLGTHPVVVLSHALWGRRFGFAEDIVGKTVQLNGQSLTVVGVAPRGFRGTHKTFSMEVWIPVSMFKVISRPPLDGLFDSRSGRMFFLIARLADGVDVRQADTALKTIAARLEAEYPDRNRDRSLTVLPLEQAAINPGQRSIYTNAGWVLAAAAGILLLIACVNIANLLLHRAMSRGKEIAVRLAMGAQRAQLVRQLLAESLVIYLLGGLAALPIAYYSLRLLWAFKGTYFDDGTLDLGLDPVVLAFTFGTALLTGVLFGLVPALRATRPDLITELKEKVSEPPSGPRRLGFGLRPSRLLIAFQVAISLVALMGAGLFIRSFAKAQQIDPGFAVDDLGVMSFNPGTQGYDEVRSRQFFERVQEMAASHPGVRSAALAEVRPLNVTFFRFVKRPEQLDEDKIRVQSSIVTPGYFNTVSIPLEQGRDFQELDLAETQRVAVVNRTMAEMLWPRQEAVGKLFQIGNEEEPIEVVGVVRDARYVSIGEDPRPFFYLPFSQRFTAGMTLHVRTTGDPTATLTALEKQVQILDPDLPVIDVQPVSEILQSALWAQRMGASLLSLYGLLTLVLAAVGIYGTVAFSLSRRDREIGIRMAVGAGRRNILRMIVIDILGTALVGVVAGILLASLLNRFFEGLLYDLSPSDPLTMVLTAILLLAVVLIAIWLPTLRATRLSPAITLREE